MIQTLIENFWTSFWRSRWNYKYNWLHDSILISRLPLFTSIDISYLIIDSESHDSVSNLSMIQTLDRFLGRFLRTQGYEFTRRNYNRSSLRLFFSLNNRANDLCELTEETWRSIPLSCGFAVASIDTGNLLLPFLPPSLSHFFPLCCCSFELVSRGVFVPLLGERSNIILTDAVHDMEKRSANEKTSYGGVSSFLRVSRLVFWFVVQRMAQSVVR